MIHRLRSFFQSNNFSHQALAILNNNRDLLHLDYDHISDIGCLPEVGITIQKYLALRDYEIAIVNDPYCGGSHLNALNLVSSLEFEGERLYFVKKMEFRPYLNICQSIEEEGLKIPPTPIYTSGTLNTAIIEAIADSPKSPDNFSAFLQREVHYFVQWLKRFEANYEIWQINFSKRNLENYFKDCQSKMCRLISEVPQVDVQISKNFDSGEQFELHFQLLEENIKANFNKSSPGKRFFTTQNAAQGAVVAGVVSALNTNIPINLGTLSCFDIEIPQGCFVSAVYPQPVFLGWVSLLPFISQSIQEKILENNKLSSVAGHALDDNLIDIKFASGKHFYDQIPGGSAGSDQFSGEPGIFVWRKNRLQASIEDLERHFPLVIESNFIRHGSGGSGIFPGGEGIHRTYLLLETAEVSWLINPGKHIAHGAKGGNEGIAPQMMLIKDGKKVQNFKASGSIQLNKGDKIHILSGGGGGFGHKSTQNL